MASRKANPAVIGAFVLGAIALSVAAALLFGSGQFFKDTSRWVIYFDSSVTGLDVGAPVIFSGVQVGSSFVYLTARDWLRVGQLFLQFGFRARLLGPGQILLAAADDSVEDGLHGVWHR